jgi:hypothetical protein
MLSRLRRADTTGLRATLVKLRAVDELQPGGRRARGCADLAELLSRGLGPAGRLDALLRADTLLRSLPHGMLPTWNYDLALAFARRAEWPAAVNAVRRRLFARPLRLAVSLRHEGQWAALAGDTAGAIDAYRHYLLFRANPEPALIPQRDSVHAELARLERKILSGPRPD